MPVMMLIDIAIAACVWKATDNGWSGLAVFLYLAKGAIL